MATVRSHFDSIFLGVVSTFDLALILNNQTCDATDGDILAEMPLDSACGEECKAALDAANLLIFHIRQAFGDSKQSHCIKAMQAAVDVCCCYIRG